MTRPLLAVFFLIVLVGCAVGSPPTAIERALYTVTTNWHTQVTPVAVIDTNRVVTATNYVTNVFATFELTPKESVITSIQAGGTIASSLGFGLGGVIASLVFGAYGAWATWRSNRRGKVSAVLTNNVEVGHETILATAGAAVAAQFISAIKSAQVKAGVKEDVAKVVEHNVDAKEAKLEAESVVSLAKSTPVP